MVVIIYENGFVKSQNRTYIIYTGQEKKTLSLRIKSFIFIISLQAAQKWPFSFKMGSGIRQFMLMQSPPAVRLDENRVQASAIYTAGENCKKISLQNLIKGCLCGGHSREKTFRLPVFNRRVRFAEIRLVLQWRLIFIAFHCEGNQSQGMISRVLFSLLLGQTILYLEERILTLHSLT